MLWLWPATIHGPLHEGTIAATVDLGCRLTLPTELHIAGLSRRRNTKLGAQLAAHLDSITSLRILAENAGTETRAHLIGDDGRNLIAALQGRDVAPPLHDYGIRPGRAWRYPGIVRQVIDADTVAVDIATGSPVRWTAHVRIRHVNAPEHGTAAGDAATAWAQQQLPEGAEVSVTSWKLEKYGRLLADVTMPDGRDYGAALLTAGHAVPYEGGPR